MTPDVIPPLPQNVTVLICTWNRADLLDETLTSLAAAHAPAGIDWEVVAVDNKSADHTRAVIERLTVS